VPEVPAAYGHQESSSRRRTRRLRPASRRHQRPCAFFPLLFSCFFSPQQVREFGFFKADSRCSATKHNPLRRTSGVPAKQWRDEALGGCIPASPGNSAGASIRPRNTQRPFPWQVVCPSSELQVGSRFLQITKPPGHLRVPPAKLLPSEFRPSRGVQCPLQDKPPFVCAARLQTTSPRRRQPRSPDPPSNWTVRAKPVPHNLRWRRSSGRTGRPLVNLHRRQPLPSLPFLPTTRCTRFQELRPRSFLAAPGVTRANYPPARIMPINRE